MSEKKTAILISGMHRGGTSSIAGVVHMLGASLPAHLMPVQPDNPRGFFESEKSMILNDRILSESGSSWHDWRSINNEWHGNPHFQKYLEEASQILAGEYGDSDFIVLKDPRFSKILPFWKIALDKSNFRVCHIIPFRHPQEAAASLLNRNAIPEYLANLAWVRHLLDAEIYSRGQPRVFVPWAEFVDDWEREALKIADHLNIAWPRPPDTVRAEVEEFLTPELRHHRVSDTQGTEKKSLNDYVNKTHAALKLFANDPNSREAVRISDSVRKDFFRTEHIYGPAFAELDAVRRRAELDRDTMAGELTRTKTQLPALTQELDAALKDGSALTVELVQARAQLVAASQDRHAAIDQAQRDRDAWAEDRKRGTALAEDLELQLKAAQRRYRLMEIRLGEFWNMNLVRKLAALVCNADRYFNPASMADESIGDAFRFDGPLQDTEPAAATLNLNALLGMNGDQFLIGAYGRLLRRLPDQNGMSFYLARLLRGVPKIEILAEIAASEEAHGSAATVPGLLSAVRRYKMSRRPFLGFFVRAFFSVEGNTPAERRLRGVEQALYMKNHR
jgi:hypothetical protein